MFAPNQYYKITSDEVDKLLYSEDSKIYNGLYLAQCEPILRCQDGPYIVCFYRNIKLIDLVIGLLLEFPTRIDEIEFFNGYDGDAGKGGLLTYFVDTPNPEVQPMGRYTSIYDGLDMNMLGDRNPKRKVVGMYIDYCVYLLKQKIPMTSCLEEEVQLRYLMSIKVHHSAIVIDGGDSIIGDCIPENLELLKGFDPNYLIE